MWRVGQKAVCVRADDNWHLVEGAIYTVTGVKPGHFGFCDGLYVAEAAHYCGTAFYATRFRPVVETKTDISVFTRMLTPSKREVASCRNS